MTPPLTLDAITRARADLAPIGEAITKADRQLFAFVTERMTAGESWWDAAKRLFADTPEADRPMVRDALFHAYTRVKAESRPERLPR